VQYIVFSWINRFSENGYPDGVRLDFVMFLRFILVVAMIAFHSKMANLGWVSQRLQQADCNHAVQGPDACL
jgi:hypothetical protein